MTLKLVDQIICDLRNNIDEKVLGICKDKVINAYKKEVDSPLKMIVKEYHREIYNLKNIEESVKMCEIVSAQDVKEIANMIEKKFNVILKEGK